MFFRKAKRIRELEKENEELKRLTHTLRNSSLRAPMFDYERLNIEKCVATDSYPPWYGLEFTECEIKHKLFSVLCPFIRIERDYSEADDKYLVRASIRVVKER